MSTEGKGRPTPKRSDAQKRRGGPVTPPPTNRREAAKQLREKNAENRTRIKHGTRAGDDSAMLPRDRGPIRRLVRDTVDARRSPAFLLLPVAALLVIAQVLADPVLVAVAVGFWLATLIAVVLDLTYTSVRLRTLLRAQFPDERKIGGHLFYGGLRTTVFRRMRMPRPQVSPGRFRK